MGTTLSEVLDLVGKLDDTPGDETARERFRRYLSKNVQDAGQIRDYVEECLRNTGDQYNRALQDLVNVIGRFLGFEVGFGRYQGVKGQIGFDGRWRSPTGFHIVVEVKTTDVYSVKTAVLMDYINQLISEKTIGSWDDVLGLYVIGRVDPEIKQLENAIVAEKRGDQLRMISVDSLLSLAEMMKVYDVRHQDIVSVLRPSGPTIDPIVDLMTRLVAGPGTVESQPQPVEEVHVPTPEKPDIADVVYWLTPVKSAEEQSAEECIRQLVGQAGIYAFGERTPGRAHIKIGDAVCFYATGTGVIAHATVASLPGKKPHPKVLHSEQYPWVFKLTDPKLNLDKPMIIDEETRARLDAFRDRKPGGNWAWFVQATHKVTEHDFRILTRHEV